MGGKNKKKKQQTPDSLKEQANLAFSRGDFQKAFSLYSEALQLNPAHQILLTNRAAALIKLHRFEEAIEDAHKARSIDENWVKSYLRLGQAYQELSDLETSLSFVEEGLAKDPHFEELQRLKDAILQEIQEGNVLSTDHSYQGKLDRFTTWLLDNGATFPKLHIKLHSTDDRGVYARSFISNSECVMFIPNSNIVMLEMAKTSPLGLKIEEAQPFLISPKHCFLSAWLLQELRKQESFWAPYLEILPRNFRTFPIFYTPEEKSWLEGSPFLAQLEEKIRDIQEDFSALCKSVPEFSQFSIEEFREARALVSSRIFSYTVNGIKTDGLVPLADMLNHKRPQQTQWMYDDHREGFVVEVLQDIERRAEVLDSYGKKCNSQYFLNYGFVVEDNTENEFLLLIQLIDDDPLFIQKTRVLEGEERRVRVHGTMQNNSFPLFLGICRLVVLDSPSVIPQILELCYNKETDLIMIERNFPISVENEVLMLKFIKDLCLQQLNRYPNTAEEDSDILNNSELTENQKNCVVLRKGEKQVLLWYIELADTCLPLFGMRVNDVKKFGKSSKYDNYILQCVVPLLINSS